MAMKCQKFKSYSEEVKKEKEPIRLHLEEKWTYRLITEHSGIQDKDRVKKWMRKYRELGEFGLLDKRGRREEYIDQDRVTELCSLLDVFKRILPFAIQNQIFLALIVFCLNVLVQLETKSKKSLLRITRWLKAAIWKPAYIWQRRFEEYPARE